MKRYRKLNRKKLVHREELVAVDHIAYLGRNAAGQFTRKTLTTRLHREYPAQQWTDATPLRGISIVCRCTKELRHAIRTSYKTGMRFRCGLVEYLPCPSHLAGNLAHWHWPENVDYETAEYGGLNSDNIPSIVGQQLSAGKLPILTIEVDGTVPQIDVFIGQSAVADALDGSLPRDRRIISGRKTSPRMRVSMGRDTSRHVPANSLSIGSQNLPRAIATLNRLLSTPEPEPESQLTRHSATVDHAEYYS